MVAGGGVWATHFISMLAYRPAFPINFGLGSTMLSLVVGIAFSTASFFLKFRKRLAIPAGIAFAIGVMSVHYIGMAAIEAPARKLWAIDLVFSSFVVCAVAATFAMKIGIKAHSLRGHIAACAMLALSVVSLHFTGMGALTLLPDPTIAPPVSQLEPMELATIVSLTVSVCLAVVVILVVSDNRISSAEARSWAKSQFLASMSHELRTPLTSIISYAEMIAENANDDARAQDQADAVVILDASRHLLALISEILDFSKLEAGAVTLEFSKVDVRCLVGALKQTSAPLFSSNRNTFACRIEDSIGTIETDQMRLRQCLLNLVSNAAKFTHDGAVSLETYLEERGGAVGVRFDVIDTGIGIPADSLKRLFDPFTQADETITRRYGGTGLGLAITKQLAQRLGGTLSVTSEPGVGSTFSLWIPQSRRPTNATTAAPALIEKAA